MAVMMYQQDLVHNLWSKFIKQLHPSSKTEFAVDEIVPEDMEGFAAFARVVCNPNRLDKSFRYLLVHAPKADAIQPSTMHQVVIHLQGVVLKLNLMTTGTWKGYAEHAPRAIQFMVLGPEADSAGFQAQLAALDNMRSMLAEMLDRQIPKVYRTENELYLQKKVFTRAQLAKGRPSVVAPWEARHEDAQRIADEWVVVDKVETGQRLADGRLQACEQSGVRIGDFVDVSVVVQISSYSDDRYHRDSYLGDRGRHAEMHLSIRQVIVLHKGMCSTGAQAIPPPTPLEIVTKNKYKLFEGPSGLDGGRACSRTGSADWSSSSSSATSEDEPVIGTPAQSDGLQTFMGWKNPVPVTAGKLEVDPLPIDDSVFLTDFSTEVDFDSEMSNWMSLQSDYRDDVTGERTTVSLSATCLPSAVHLCALITLGLVDPVAPDCDGYLYIDSAQFRIRGIRYLSRSSVEFLQHLAHLQRDDIVPLYDAPSTAQWEAITDSEKAFVGSEAGNILILSDNTLGGGRRNLTLRGVPLRKADSIALVELIHRLECSDSDVRKWSQTTFTCTEEDSTIRSAVNVHEICQPTIGTFDDFRQIRFTDICVDDIVLVYFSVARRLIIPLIYDDERIRTWAHPKVEGDWAFVIGETCIPARVAQLSTAMRVTQLKFIVDFLTSLYAIVVIISLSSPGGRVPDTTVVPPVVVPSWYQTLSSIPMYLVVKCEDPRYIKPFESDNGQGTRTSSRRSGMQCAAVGNTIIGSGHQRIKQLLRVIWDTWAISGKYDPLQY
ncbi:hypothetical protein NM688_g6785 [Phlebia brevispora]|uniref:Uncharacterized protein n=1 Tax=Phlebia brevispora TaxID=194682 RepID=A0ACC1SCY4_9APHY|nr:hypothetical protein NM688_g6785 [Phlebia brevispora]